jgi:hypothetical protein
MNSSIACSGCDYVAPPLDPRPFRCPRAGDGGDHILVRHLKRVDAAPFFDPEPNPFIRYRQLTHAWHTAMALGVTDSEFVALVRELRRARGGSRRPETSTTSDDDARRMRPLLAALNVQRAGRRCRFPGASPQPLNPRDDGEAVSGLTVDDRARQAKTHRQHQLEIALRPRRDLNRRSVAAWGTIFHA